MELDRWEAVYLHELGREQVLTFPLISNNSLKINLAQAVASA